MEEYNKDKLRSILIETVHTLVMFPYHKSYTREVILQEDPDINPQELSAILGISLGESLVILQELRDQQI